MYCSEVQADSVRRALERGFERDEAQRLAFVRWSMHEGYAQFNEFITSDAPVVGTRDGMEQQRAAAHN